MTPSCPSRSLVDRHFAATITPHAERALRQHLPDCEVCRERYERHLVLASLDRRVPAMQDRLARGLGLAPPRRPATRWAGLALGLAAASAALVLLWQAPPQPAPPLARGGGVHDADQALYIYRIAPGESPRPVLDGAIRAGDELAFAYQNRRGWTRLLVWAIDEAQRVYWYHPGWTDPAATPVAIAIDAGPDHRELPEAVAQPLRPGRLWLHALFTDEAVDVRAIERGQRPARGEDIVIALDVLPEQAP
ncbi:MAG TPA: hypothetical protein VHW23_00015 [Kofleriaceae bacterium]|jgi:hypothetical protein|nr:hypothetical protein [Kofleriaceae bacterium]